MTWRVSFTPKAERELAALDGRVRTRILTALARLQGDPFTAPNVKALVGGGHRLRVGDWRVLFEVMGDQLVVLVVKVGHRREVYR
ncbi:Type II toxin-antitoxin system RelE/ParE family toxin (plasmid) [Rhodovastum atsumiense]|uniref:Type II toxin-antitoxin system RelE/ParE family toxin n=1 Tax=Rhodovastum atsumiense TaxID=504468 RepID=A0A5M6IIX2_9PROT|nr:type II toxin-antitoxin system RelE/ParE family toxin [Rhodovastum atsumiense]KAA5608072.1 type II toxin-antitoxin system RelE/ParE family toxin [Rhodovastum atsumiense]CAH2606527.1 Type II toxin-antitoxin system RelE/ParE family toxin [Rhodovastum atsumiense]